MKKLIGIIAIVFVLSFGCAGNLKGQETPKERNSLERFIPVELWTGIQWDGKEMIRMAYTDTAFGKRMQKRIKGPFHWYHPVTGEKILVYERTKKLKKGLKYQLFALNMDKSGIGKVFDERPGRKTRSFQGEVLFPLGYWRQGETRSFRYNEFINRAPVIRNARITIKRINFKYKHIPLSLEYDWILTDSKGSVIFHENYIYSPGESMVRFKNLLKQKK